MKILLKKITNASVNDYVPIIGELLANTDSKRIHIGDASSPGGQVMGDGSAANALSADPPTLNLPADGDSFPLNLLLIETSPYSGAGIHVGTEYQISTNPEFTAIAYIHYSTTDLLTHMPYQNGFQSVILETPLYIRARHNSSIGSYSDWSNTVTYTPTVSLPIHEVGMISTNTGAPYDNIGTSVALTGDGSQLFVGVQGDDTVYGNGAGSVYTYTLSSAGIYVQGPTILTVNGGPNDQFGKAMAVSADGSILAVGSFRYDTVGKTDNGAVHIFMKDANGDYQEHQLMIAPVPENYAGYGVGIAMSSDGSRLLVGAWEEATSVGINAGAVHVYDLDASNIYQYTGRLVRGQGPGSFRFGVALSLSGDGNRLLVGLPFQDTAAGVDAGIVEIYDWDAALGEYVFHSELSDPTGAGGDDFGFAVYISDDKNILVISSCLDNYGSVTNAGSVFVFKLDSSGTYTKTDTIRSASTASGDSFGRAIALSDDLSIMVVGANSDNTTHGTNAGATYHFTAV